MKIIKWLGYGMGFTVSLLIVAVLVMWAMTDHNNVVLETVTDDHTSPAVRINGVRLHARSVGNPDAPKLVVLPCGPGGDFRSLIGLSALQMTMKFISRIRGAQGFRSAFHQIN